MSHTPPLPEASVAPFPAQPAPTPSHEKPVRSESTAAEDKTRRVIAGAAVGIGSAALVAALLYANRKPGRGAVPTPQPPKVPSVHMD